jgi:hypothetical protein
MVDQSGGLIEVGVVLVAFAQELSPDVQARVKRMLNSDDDDVAMYAIEYLTKWGAGAPPKKPRLEVPASATVLINCVRVTFSDADRRHCTALVAFIVFGLGFDCSGFGGRAT